MEYHIVEATSIDMLESQIEMMLMDGWLPQGGVAVGKDESGLLFYLQAMIKKPE